MGLDISSHDCRKARLLANTQHLSGEGLDVAKSVFYLRCSIRVYTIEESLFKFDASLCKMPRFGYD